MTQQRPLTPPEIRYHMAEFGRSIQAGLLHMQEEIKRTAEVILESYPSVILTRSIPEEWVCSICSTGLLKNPSKSPSVYIHVCQKVEDAS